MPRYSVAVIRRRGAGCFLPAGSLHLLAVRTSICYKVGHVSGRASKAACTPVLPVSKETKMSRNTEELHGITLLGNQKTEYRSNYAPEVLEAFDNKHQGNDYFVKFVCPEFTSLCPMTGQPDFATIVIRYIPDVKMVESKSLKLYLFSFRNHGDFHEDCVNIIMKDLIGLMNPKYIEVFGEFTPRGGIAIHPFANYGRAGTPFEQMARERLFRHDMQ